MNTEISVNKVRQGQIFYDAACPLCVRSVFRSAPLLEKLGFECLPLQNPGTAALLGVTEDALFARMHLLTADGRRLAGADAFIEIARHARWAKPLVSLASLPAVLPLLRSGYDWIAANRYCLGGTCALRPRQRFTGWLPLLLLPVTAFLIREQVAAWIFMWAMAFSLYAGCKWLTYRKAVARGMEFTHRRALGYLLGWVGMEPVAFANANAPFPEPRKTEWLVAIGRVILGVALVWGGVRFLHDSIPAAAGWLGMFGIILLLHFGLFQLLALGWQRAGVPVKPLMRAPLLAASLGDFWGARWDTGFHALAHEFAFRPLCRHIGNRFAMLAVFIISGLVHELVITLPARGGYGLPTIYFALQGLGLLLERSPFGRKLGLGSGVRGRAFALLVAAAPAFWLFPPVFVQNVILPMLHAIGAT